METLTDWGILALGLIVTFSFLKILRNYFKRVSQQEGAYKRAVEKINRVNTEQEEARLLERFNRDKKADSAVGKNSRGSGIYQNTMDRNSIGDFLSVPSQLVDSNFNLYGMDISADNSQDVSATMHYDVAGHGGSFGGGGASGSWSSDDNSSNSYSDSSSDSGGSDSGSNYND